MIRIGGFDIETTGLLHPEHRIIEAAIVRYDYDPATHKFTEIGADEWRIQPHRRIDPKAFETHGISRDDLEGAPEWTDVAPQIVDRLNECQIVVAHNGTEFDFPFLIQELDRIKHPLPDFEPFDTMLNGRWASPWGNVPNLKALCYACDVEYDEAQAHGATYDVRVTMLSFFNALKFGGFTLPKL